ncbi:NUDIX domain-containing protein [uncultured Ilyobacter sp.]|jgi:tRNA nucleotidyltransferase (CCA-adding enzyme)|uniref:bis(5'-nucleosyl)-tetraphosphatase n=1 Tax=uncultured Ilyobacter sp. TaxID=544433 RepID=UPI0029C0F2FA|nr:NUDIX domain-containing protein [uncultured Ilyobacter sp.]
MIWEKSCGGIIVFSEEDKDKFLVIKQLSGYYGFPKGHIEDNETEEETALREVYEEVGIKAEIIEGFRETLDYRVNKNIMKEAVFFLMKSDKKNVTLDKNEVLEYAWLDYKEAWKKITFEEEREAFLRAYEYLKEVKNGR